MMCGFIWWLKKNSTRLRPVLSPFYAAAKERGISRIEPDSQPPDENNKTLSN